MNSWPKEATAFPSTRDAAHGRMGLQLMAAMTMISALGWAANERHRPGLSPWRRRGSGKAVLDTRSHIKSGIRLMKFFSASFFSYLTSVFLCKGVDCDAAVARRATHLSVIVQTDGHVGTLF